jgi:hypothetical protein
VSIIEDHFDQGKNPVANQDRWEERYKKGDTPWDTGIPDLNL